MIIHRGQQELCFNVIVIYTYSMYSTNGEIHKIHKVENSKIRNK